MRSSHGLVGAAHTVVCGDDGSLRRRWSMSHEVRLQVANVDGCLAQALLRGKSQALLCIAIGLNLVHLGLQPVFTLLVRRQIRKQLPILVGQPLVVEPNLARAALGGEKALSQRLSLAPHRCHRG